MNELLTLEEVSEYLRISLHQVRILIRSGNLKGINISQGKKRAHYRVKREDLDTFIEAGGILNG